MVRTLKAIMIGQLSSPPSLTKMKTSPSLLQFSILLCFFSWTTLVISIDVEGQLAWNPLLHGGMYLVALYEVANSSFLLPDISQISPDSRVIIGPRQQDKAFIREDGTFVLQDVRPGKHVLRVACREFGFLRLMIDVSESDNEAPIVKPYVPGQASPPVGYPEPRLSYPIRLVATNRLQYVEERAGFNPLSMLLANPMYLLMGGMFVFMMIMPKIMNMMDPEALAEVQANQANMHKQMASMQSLDFASGLSKMLSPTGDDDTPDQVTSKSTASGSKATSGNNAKKRK
ncbi:uncharacterized protein MELLADRAFT_92800 [Melampsora larici-populina 98AG31]|uniref:ER membrane protein complex subunit 7 beta-sandwich domain-containing protein n=1 Tax=Melampsora larici-populina (strain 98AG31 / pathotype 3-4-7) TaxID=747676 RepID=F4S2T1_MELLP|nr:uncharacterized protein MELLADRAFT_92800 [Melampsora larici-populina 98AG31]EGG01053.1 hypothetical protein MELLADRAFT_92800 [Melampsora larici-populina 98AG31]